MSGLSNRSGLIATALAMAAVSGVSMVQATPDGAGRVLSASETHRDGNRQPVDRTPAMAHSSLLRRLLGSGGFGGPRRQRRAAYGWTNAHAKRVAAKKRRVKAHRSRA